LLAQSKNVEESLFAEKGNMLLMQLQAIFKVEQLHVEMDLLKGKGGWKLTLS